MSLGSEPQSESILEIILKKRKFMNILLQAVQMTDDVTVSSLPHPISMFFLGIFAVSIVYVVIESNRVRKEWGKIKNSLDNFESRFGEHKNETENKLSEMSKKIDSRVDKALLGLAKKKEIL
jgi:predicted neutral ceramidase superfamily lipid hydrolase